VPEKPLSWLFCYRVSHAADFAKPVLKTELIKASYWQSREYSNALKKHPVSVLKGERNFRFRSLCFGGVGDAPMRRHWLSRPHRTCFTRRVVANGKNKIERRRAGLCEFVPRFGAKAGRIITKTMQQLNRVRIDLSLGLTSGAVGPEFPLPDLVQDRFCKN